MACTNNMRTLRWELQPIQTHRPRKRTQVVTLEIHIREVLGSNPHRDTDYPDRSLSSNFSVLPGKSMNITSNYARTGSFYIHHVNGIAESLSRADYGKTEE
jgi:hypothetical protein